MKYDRSEGSKMTTEELLLKLYVANRETFIKRYTRAVGENDIEDLVQESFYRALRSKEAFTLHKSTHEDNHAALEIWFNSILYNCIKDIINDQRMAGVACEVDDILDEGDIETSYILGATMGEVEAKIDEVRSNSSREVLRLHFILGFKPREISDVVENNITSIYKIINNFKNRKVEKL